MAKLRIATLLRTGLEHAAESAYGVSHLDALGDPSRNRLLAIQVLTRFDRSAEDHPVPVIGDAAPDSVDIVTREHVAEIVIDFTTVEALLAQPLGIEPVNLLLSQ
jgi:hypothetical protein